MCYKQQKLHRMVFFRKMVDTSKKFKYLFELQYEIKVLTKSGVYSITFIPK